MSEHLESQLRQSAPQLPPDLRSRTLARCAVQREVEHRRQRTQLRWVWGLAGMCAIQWFTVSYLDAQNAALVQGPHPSALVASAPPVSSDEINRNLLARLQLIADLAREFKDSRPPSHTG